MMQKLIYFIFVVLLINTNTSAQNEMNYSQLVHNLGFANPSYYTRDNLWAANLLYRNQWTGIQGAPQNIGFDLRKGFNKLGFGLGIKGNVDIGGARNTSLIGLNFNTGIQLTKYSHMLFGLFAGAELWRYGLEGEEINDSDIFDLGNINRMAISPGITYSYKGLNLGASFKVSLKGSTTLIEKNVWNYYGHASYDFEFGEIDNEWGLKPVALYGYSSVYGPRFDIGAVANWNQFIYFGMVYRYLQSLSTLIEFKLFSNLFLSYSYDLNINSYTQALGSSHEVALKWNVNVFRIKPCWCEDRYSNNNSGYSKKNKKRNRYVY